MQKHISWRLRACWLFALLLVTFAGDRTAALVLDRLFVASGFRFGAMCRGASPAKTLIIGNSRGVHSFFAPDIEAVTGETCFNLSFNGLPATVVPSLLNIYLEKNDPPERLLLEVTCVGSESGNRAGSLNRFSILFGHSADLRELFRREKPNDFVALHISHLLRFNSELTWRSFRYLGESDQNWINRGKIKTGVVEALPTVADLKVSESQTDLEAIKTTLEIAASRGIRTELIVAPYLPKYRRSLSGLEDWCGWLEAGLEHPVHDFSDSLGDDVAFADRFHMNRAGSKLFLALLKERRILD